MSDAAYDEADDFPPANGFERRQKPRRQQDEWRDRLEAQLAHLLVSRVKLGAVITSLVAFLTWFFTSLGYRYTGPVDDIKALRADVLRRDSVMNVRVSRLEEGQSEVKLQLAAIEEQIRFVVFLQCAQIRTTNPNLVDGCPARRTP